VGVQLRLEFDDVFIGQTEFVIGDGKLVVGLVFEVEERLGIGGGEGVEAGDVVGREAGGVGEVLLEPNGLVVAAIVEELVEELEGGEEVVLFQKKVHDAVAQRRTLHLHSHTLTPFSSLPTLVLLLPSFPPFSLLLPLSHHPCTSFFYFHLMQLLTVQSSLSNSSFYHQKKKEKRTWLTSFPSKDADKE